MAFALLEKTIYALFYHRQEEGFLINMTKESESYALH